MTFINGRTASDLDETAYRAFDAWSISQIKHVDRPEWFHGLYVAKPPLFEFDETAGMLFGTNCHAEFLEGKQCSPVPDWALTSNGQRRGKNWDLYKESHSALECLSAKEIEAVRGMRASIEAQPRIANLLFGEGPVELPLFATDDETGLNVKGKLDKLRKADAGLIIGDLKITSIDVDDGRQVAAKVHAMRYHYQAAFYWDLVAAALDEAPIAFIFVFCSNKPPYTARAWRIDDNALDLGRRRYRVALADLKTRLDTGNWSGERHNSINFGPDGCLLPKYAFTDDPGDNTPMPYGEFSDYQTEGTP